MKLKCHFKHTNSVQFINVFKVHAQLKKTFNPLSVDCTVKSHELLSLKF